MDDSAFRDLVVPGVSNTSHTGPTYTDTSARPQGVGGGFGARFDGVDDILTATPLHIPSELAADFLPAYPINYTGIDRRGLQMWVRPDQAGLDAGVRQTIVMDTVRSGGVAITTDGKWDQIFDSEFEEGDIVATVNVVGNTWYHVMQHIHETGEPGAPKLVVGTQGESGFTSVVYVDGVAVSAINDDHRNADGHLTGDRVGLLTVGGAELPDQDADPATADLGQYFDGTIDDLRLYVFGDNSSEGGQNFGTFDLFSDNDWIANEIARPPLMATCRWRRQSRRFGHCCRRRYAVRQQLVVTECLGRLDGRIDHRRRLEHLGARRHEPGWSRQSGRLGTD